MTKSQVRWILIGCLAAAVLLIVFTPRWTKNIGKKEAVVEQAAVATVDALDGRVNRRAFKQETTASVSAGQSILHWDRVFIESRSYLEISLAGYKLRIMGPGEVVFERWTPADLTSPVVLHLISGQLDLVTEGERGKVYVTKDRQMLDPKGASLNVERGLIISSLALLGAPGITIPIVSEGQSSIPAVSMAGENDSEPLPGSLTNAYLDGEIAKEAEQFQRCQANSLRDKSDAKGQVVIGMTISPDGRVSDLHVMTSTIQDDKLHGCVLQIFSRLKFRPFKGAPIVRSYPLSFE